jgi:hypothetical protein
MRADIGNLTLHEFIDQKATVQPDAVYFTFPTSSTLESWINVNIASFKRAIDQVSWWLHGVLDNQPAGKTFCYVAASDIRYMIILIASGQIGSKVSNCLDDHKSYYQ